MLAHTLGNPFDLSAVTAFCKRHGLWLIEDNCDALGFMYHMESGWQMTGTVGDIGTSSFYPAHHITMGEGGAVYTQDPLLHKIIRSLWDWGRECICPGDRITPADTVLQDNLAHCLPDMTTSMYIHIWGSI